MHWIPNENLSPAETWENIYKLSVRVDNIENDKLTSRRHHRPRSFPCNTHTYTHTVSSQIPWLCSSSSVLFVYELSPVYPQHSRVNLQLWSMNGHGEESTISSMTLLCLFHNCLYILTSQIATHKAVLIPLLIFSLLPIS